VPQIIVSRSFDLDGNLLSETHPLYNTGGTPQTTSFVYDSIGRLTGQTNPDGTFKTFVHDIDTRAHVPWSGGGSAPIPLTKITTTDELNRPSVVSSDADGRPVEIHPLSRTRHRRPCGRDAPLRSSGAASRADRSRRQPMDLQL
jgi:YD repeat-containing protein